MPIQNQHWYNENESRNYPIDDICSAIDDSGVGLPTNIITDLRLRWPAIAGSVAFVGAVTVSPGVVTVLILAADSLDAVTGFTPLAAISLPIADVEEGRQYQLQAQYPHTAGYITFGSGTQASYAGRFTTPRQTALNARSAKPYKDLPVSSLGKYNSRTALYGVVTLLGEDPVAVVKETRTIEGVELDVIVVKLTDSPEQAAAENRSRLELYSGPCNKRPESRNCGNPQPIEEINTVTPNCNGEITINFTGQVIPGIIPSDCGVFLDLDVGLPEVCVPPVLPDDTGVLPNEVAPLVIVPPDDENEEDDDIVINDEVIVLGEFPYCTRFYSLDESAFVSESGAWEYLASNSLTPVEELRQNLLCPIPGGVSVIDYPGSFTQSSAIAFSGRNILLWYGFDITSFNRVVETDIKLLAGQSGSKRNAGIIINAHIAVNGLMTYYCMELDHDTQSLRLMYFNGNTSFLIAKATLPGIELNHWYRLTVETTPVNGQGVFITGTLRSATDDDFPIAVGVVDTPLLVLGPVLAVSYLPDGGHFGFTTNRARSEFSCFKINASDII